jgi:predicted HTH domain antitoxin
VTIEVPDIQAIERLSAADLRLELACALYARALIGKVAGADLAGIDFFAFQRALKERGVPMYTEQMLEDELASIKSLFGA